MKYFSLNAGEHGIVKQANKHIRIEKKIITFSDLYIKRRHQQEILRGKSDMHTELNIINNAN